jgi:hypothetical protein
MNASTPSPASGLDDQWHVGYVYGVDVLEQRPREGEWRYHRPFPAPPGRTWPFDTFAALEAHVTTVAAALREQRLTRRWHRDGTGAIYERNLTPDELAHEFPAVAQALDDQGETPAPAARLRLRVAEIAAAAQS